MSITEGGVRLHLCLEVVHLLTKWIHTVHVLDNRDPLALDPLVNHVLSCHVSHLLVFLIVRDLARFSLEWVLELATLIVNTVDV